MGGVNLRDGCMEVAFEQWTEPGQQDLDDSSVENKDAPGSRLQRHSPVTGNGIGAPAAYECAEAPVLAESRDKGALNLGGNTDGYSP